VAFDRECFFSELHEIMANKATFVDFRGGGDRHPGYAPGLDRHASVWLWRNSCDKDVFLFCRAKRTIKVQFRLTRILVAFRLSCVKTKFCSPNQSVYDR